MKEGFLYVYGTYFRESNNATLEQLASTNIHF